MSKPKVVTAYKAFDQNWKCRDFQYEVGKTYEMDGSIVPCARGFHACTIPDDVFRYYDMATSKIARVSVVDPVSHEGDSKVASAKITIEAELTMPEWITATVDAIFALCGKPKKADSSLAASGSDSSLAASGNASSLAASGYDSRLAASGYASSLAASGDASRLAASGDDSRLAASGYASSLAASGYASRLAASGDDSRLAASGYASSLAASGYDSRLAASGYDSRLAASGYASSLAASGDASRLAASGNDSSLAASGYDSSLAASGYFSRARVGANGAIALAYCDGKRPRFAVGYVGEDGIKADTWYRVENGKLTEAK